MSASRPKDTKLNDPLIRFSSTVTSSEAMRAVVTINSPSAIFGRSSAFWLSVPNSWIGSAPVTIVSSAGIGAAYLPTFSSNAVTPRKLSPAP